MGSTANSILHPSKTTAEPITLDSDMEVVSRSRSQIENIGGCAMSAGKPRLSKIADTYTCLLQFAAVASFRFNTPITVQIISSSCGTTDCLSAMMTHDARLIR